jgi:catalase
VAVLAGDGVDGAGIAALAAGVAAARARTQVVAPHGGVLDGADGTPVPVTKAFITSESVEVDVVVVAGGASAASLAADPAVAMYVQEAYRHHKPIAAWGEGVEVLERAGIPVDGVGVVTADAVDAAFLEELIASAGRHRHWDRPSLLSAAVARA